MRLIDADRLMDSLRGNVLIDVTAELENEVAQQPTAFDKEKVIADLAKCKESAEEIWSAIDSEQDFGETMAYMNAIRVVEKGGIE